MALDAILRPDVPQHRSQHLRADRPPPRAVNPKVFVVAAVAALVAALGVIAVAGQTVIDDVSGGPGGFLQAPGEAPVPIEEVQVRLVGITVDEVHERAATLTVRLEVTNPNEKSVILQYLKYELFEGGSRVHVGEIGDRPSAFVTESNYFTLLSGQPTVLTDTVTLRNTGSTPDLWRALSDGTAAWRISGEAFFNISSMTRGGENTVLFDLEQAPGAQP